MINRIWRRRWWEGRGKRRDRRNQNIREIWQTNDGWFEIDEYVVTDRSVSDHRTSKTQTQHRSPQVQYLILFVPIGWGKNWLMPPTKPETQFLKGTFGIGSVLPPDLISMVSQTLRMKRKCRYLNGFGEWRKKKEEEENGSLQGTNKITLLLREIWVFHSIMVKMVD